MISHTNHQTRGTEALPECRRTVATAALHTPTLTPYLMIFLCYASLLLFFASLFFFHCHRRHHHQRHQLFSLYIFCFLCAFCTCFCFARGPVAQYVADTGHPCHTFIIVCTLPHSLSTVQSFSSSCGVFLPYLSPSLFPYYSISIG